MGLRRQCQAAGDFDSRQFASLTSRPAPSARVCDRGPASPPPLWAVPDGSAPTGPCGTSPHLCREPRPTPRQPSRNSASTNFGPPVSPDAYWLAYACLQFVLRHDRDLDSHACSFVKFTADAAQPGHSQSERPGTCSAGSQAARRFQTSSRSTRISAGASILNRTTRPRMEWTVMWMFPLITKDSPAFLARSSIIPSFRSRLSRQRNLGDYAGSLSTLAVDVLGAAEPFD